MTDTALTRRQFFCALAASVVAAGVPLPVGVREARAKFQARISYHRGDFRELFEMPIAGADVEEPILHLTEREQMMVRLLDERLDKIDKSLTPRQRHALNFVAWLE